MNNITTDNQQHIVTGQLNSCNAKSSLGYVRCSPHVLTAFRYLFLLIAISASQPSLSQNNTCGNAVAQLQDYVAQVNALANAEYYQNIPYVRCQRNPGCMQWWLGQLNNWYMQQTSLVNGWYSQIIQQCSQQNTPRGRIPSTRQTNNEPGEIDEDTVEDIEVDDEDKTVRIKIPSTPKGFR